MIARPDWFRRKYIFSGLVMAASFTLLLAAGRESVRGTPVTRLRAPAWPEGTTSYTVVTASGTLKVVPVYDAWKPYDAPAEVRRQADTRSR